MSGLKTHIAVLFSSLLLLVGGSGTAWSAEDVMAQTQFSFQHQTISIGNDYQDAGFWRDERSAVQNMSILKNNDVFGRLNQYDATISYPFRSHNNINLNLGLNIRFLDGELSQYDAGSARYSLNMAMPMFYANALYVLPNSGLSASLGARHFNYEQYYALDYKAKLSYQWQSGFGLEGGWQHQQFSIDGGDIQAEIENKGPFLDFNYRF